MELLARLWVLHVIAYIRGSFTGYLPLLVTYLLNLVLLLYSSYFRNFIEP